MADADGRSPSPSHQLRNQYVNLPVLSLRKISHHFVFATPLSGIIWILELRKKKEET